MSWSAGCGSVGSYRRTEPTTSRVASGSMRGHSLLLIAVQLLCGVMAVACTAEADLGNAAPQATPAPTATISGEELVEWCLEYLGGASVTVFEPRSEGWMRDCEERFVELQAFLAAKELHQTQLSDAESAWCEQRTVEVFQAAKSLDLEGIPTDIDDWTNREFFETVWLYDSPEDYVRACSTAFGSRD